MQTEAHFNDCVLTPGKLRENSKQYASVAVRQQFLWMVAGRLALLQSLEPSGLHGFVNHFTRAVTPTNTPLYPSRPTNKGLIQTAVSELNSTSRDVARDASVALPVAEQSLLCFDFGFVGNLAQGGFYEGRGSMMSAQQRQLPSGVD